MIEKLNKLFIARYGKRFAELNSNIYIAAKNDKGNYEVPVPSLGGGGGTIVVGRSDGAFKLQDPAIVKVENKEMKEQIVLYRIAFPFSEMQIAANKPEYFNYLVDGILIQGLKNYAATFGDDKQVRFGTTYCTYLRPGESGDSVFKSINDEYVELRLYGSWASNEVA